MTGVTACNSVETLDGTWYGSGMEAIKVQTSRKQGSIRYYVDLLGLSMREVQGKLSKEGGREELDALVETQCIVIEEARDPALIQKKLIALNEDSLMHCAISFNKWARTDKTKNKYAYNESAKTDLLFMKTWVDMTQIYKNAKRK